MTARSEFGVDVDYVDELVVDELLEAEAEQFAAVAGTTDAAEGQVRLDHRRMVDEHHAGGNLPGHFRAVLGIGGEYRAAQTEWRVIGDAHGVSLVLGAEQHRDRPEKFPITRWIVIGDIGQNRRLHKGSPVWNRGPDLDRLGAMGHRLTNLVLELVRRALR